MREAEHLERAGLIMDLLKLAFGFSGQAAAYGGARYAFGVCRSDGRLDCLIWIFLG